MGLSAAIAALALAAPPAVDGRGTIDALERSRVTSEGGAELTTHALEATPRAELRLNLAPVELAGAYGALLRIPEVTGEARLDVLHRGDLRFGARASTSWRLDVSATGERGTTDLRSTTARDGDPSPVPTLADVRLARAATHVRLSGRPDPRTAFTLDVQATAGGGQDATSRTLLPVQQTVLAAARLAWNATRHDVLSGVAEAGAGRTLDPHRRFGEASLRGGLAHRFSRTLEVSGGAGAAVLASQEEDRLLGVQPVVEAGLSHALERPMRVDSVLSLRLAPYLDRVLGGVSERVEGSGGSTWRIAPAWRAGARAQASRSLTGGERTLHASSELRLDWSPPGHVRVALGASGEWQRAIAGNRLPAFTEYGVFVEMGLDSAHAIHEVQPDGTLAPRAQPGPATPAQPGREIVPGGRDEARTP